jgi:hypothetical protein
VKISGSCQSEAHKLKKKPVERKHTAKKFNIAILLKSGYTCILVFGRRKECMGNFKNQEPTPTASPPKNDHTPNILPTKCLSTKCHLLNSYIKGV